MSKSLRSMSKVDAYVAMNRRLSSSRKGLGTLAAQDYANKLNRQLAAEISAKNGRNHE